MGSLKTLKIQIRGVKSTRKLTEAVRLISTSRMRQVRNKRKGASEYIKAFWEFFGVVLRERFDEVSSVVNNIFVGDPKRNDRASLYILITSDRGLCAQFNSSLVKFLTTSISSSSSKKKIMILCVGKKGYSGIKSNLDSGKLKAHDIDVQLSNCLISDIKNFNFTVARTLFDEVTALSQKLHFDEVNVLYNEFISILQYEARIQKLLPIASIEDFGSINPNSNDVDDGVKGGSSGSLKNSVGAQRPYTYEPDFSGIVSYMKSQYIMTAFYNALLSSMLSEHSARMTAMDSATRNSDKLLDKLNTKYNKTRQMNITKELIEIISGMNALEESSA